MKCSKLRFDERMTQSIGRLLSEAANGYAAEFK